MRRHGFAPIAGDLVDPAVISGAAGPGISGISVDGAEARQHDWPVIVIELVGEEKCAGKAVILRAVMTVVFVGRNRIPAKAVVLRYICRQPVVMAEQERLTITRHDQLRRNGSVEGPDRVRVLRRETRMELQRDRRSRIDAGVVVRRASGVVNRVRLRLGLRHLN